MMNRETIIGLSVIMLVIGFFSASLFVSTDSSETGNKNKEFQEDFFVYSQLLDTENLDIIRKTIDGDEDLEVIEKLISVAIYEVVVERNPDFKNKFEDVIKDVNNNRSEDSYFKENTACSGLKSNIESGLDTSETFDFVFYSPTYDNCLYVTNDSVPVEAGSYESDTYKRVYRTDSNNQLKSYRTYRSGQYDDVSESEKSAEELSKFIKFILENSNYNVDLVRDEVN